MTTTPRDPADVLARWDHLPSNVQAWELASALRGALAENERLKMGSLGNAWDVAATLRAALDKAEAVVRAARKLPFMLTVPDHELTGRELLFKDALAAYDAHDKEPRDG